MERTPESNCGCWEYMIGLEISGQLGYGDGLVVKV